MPVIAVARCNKLSDYEESIRRAGADVLVVDPSGPRPEHVIASVDGLVLTGGGDVQPSLYGATAHPTIELAEEGRDEYEIALVRLATEADLPVLAICRGLQVLNVARGGTLVQDISDQVGTAVIHRVPTPRDATAHEISLRRGSLLERVLNESTHGTGTRGVNSRHHQAVKEIGADLIVTATAPDGVVEAAEDPRRRFLIGVQWHPENFCRTGEFRQLFEGFIRAVAVRRP